MFGWGPNNIFEQDVPAPTPQPSVYEMSQLLADINTLTPEDHSEEYPLSSPTTEAALQTSDLDGNDDVEQEAPSHPELKDKTVEEGRFQDPCLPSPPHEPIPQAGSSEQRFDQESSQSEPDPSEECVREMERTACHLDTSYAITGQDTITQEASHLCLWNSGQRMLADWYMPRKSMCLSEAKTQIQFE